MGSTSTTGLKLRRETVRDLAGETLADAAGGVAITQGSVCDKTTIHIWSQGGSCDSICNCTTV